MPARARRVAALALALGLAGCAAVGPDYAPPEVPVPKSFRFAEQDAREAANTAWWQQFGDPTLEALIGEALANNLDVRIATARVEQYAARIAVVDSARFPQVGYGADAARARATENAASPLPAGYPNPQSSYQAALSVGWELDLWGRIRRQTEAAQADYLASAQARSGVVLSLVAAVADAYVRLLGFDGQLAISRRTLATYAETLKLFELQFKYGVISQINVEQVRSQHANVARVIPQVESRIARTEDALSLLLGRDPGPIERSRGLADLAYPAVPAGLPSDLLERRPDIREAEQALISANAQIGAAKALYYPTISLTGALGLASGDLSDLFRGPSRTWSFAGSIAGPIFTGGAIEGQVRQAEAAQRAALVAYRKAIQSAFGDVADALVARQKLVDELRAAEASVRALTEYARLARLQYDGGYASYLTVLDAQRSLFDDELNLAQTHTQLLQASIALYKAMGGGWVDVAERAAGGAYGPGR